MNSSIMNGKHIELLDLQTELVIEVLQPQPTAEVARGAIFSHLVQLIHTALPEVQVYCFGSFPIKCFLPDGDLDLCIVFPKGQTNRKILSKEGNTESKKIPKNQRYRGWSYDLKRVLLREQQNKFQHQSIFPISSVQSIQAEVELIKCFVSNVAVDISVGQIHGLSVVCFLEEIDRKIGNNHLFKRSLLLIKGWFYYESRILGSGHGLIATYALECMLLYVFNTKGAIIKTPLNSLYLLLKEMNEFDWDTQYMTIWGARPLAEITSNEKGRANNLIPPFAPNGEPWVVGESMIKMFSRYHEDSPGSIFPIRNINILDPLSLGENNIGRSVSVSNCTRIRKCWKIGFNHLSKLLSNPQKSAEYFILEFFPDTWARHGRGVRPDLASHVQMSFAYFSSSSLSASSSTSSFQHYADADNISNSSFDSSNSISLASLSLDSPNRKIQNTQQKVLRRNSSNPQFQNIRYHQIREHDRLGLVLPSGLGKYNSTGGPLKAFPPPSNIDKSSSLPTSPPLRSKMRVFQSRETFGQNLNPYSHSMKQGIFPSNLIRSQSAEFYVTPPLVGGRIEPFGGNQGPKFDPFLSDVNILYESLYAAIGLENEEDKEKRDKSQVNGLLGRAPNSGFVAPLPFDYTNTSFVGNIQPFSQQQNSQLSDSFWSFGSSG